MARRVYFAFHYQRDIWRVNHVRMQNTTRASREEIAVYDASLWEEAQKKGEASIKAMINGGLNNTSATCVLIGNETYSRPWVRYEIIKSYARGNALIGVHIHNQEDRNGKSDLKGKNPFEYLALGVSADGKKISFTEWDGKQWISYSRFPDMSANCTAEHWGKTHKLSKFYPLYDWIDDDGYNNFGAWIEAAAKTAGR